MTKKIKTKKSVISSGKTRGHIQRTKKYPAYNLAIVLAGVLVLEGILFGVCTSADWQKGKTLLDVSDGITQTVRDTEVTFQPMMDLVDSVNRFYQLSATEMTLLLDISGTGVGSEFGIIYNGVSDFYEQSSDQMAQLLDISNDSWRTPMSGVSITVK